MIRRYDCLVIGGGLAGASVALRLSNLGKKVALIAKRELAECSSYLAQGGIAAVINPADSFEKHIEDTLTAGAGLCNLEAVRWIVENAPEGIDWLIKQGVEFSQEAGHIHLTREGGHSERRILHVADSTGKAVIETLIQKVIQDPNIEVFENHIAVDLILDNNKCLGSYIFYQNKVETFLAAHTVLATGGAGKAYLYTTNPDIATGDGIAMAYRAGVPVSNMEFIQFHPTCLFNPQAKSFLITEAIRGEGGILRLPDGTRFMEAHDSRLELAPRDIVARAIDYEMKKYGLDYVYLDISHKPKDFIIEHFPNIYAKCLSLGLDISRESIPVVPAAHYTCGGVVTNLYGKTNIESLYAVGECACTGLHGANRLASNSLLECLVIGQKLVEDMQKSSLVISDSKLTWDDTQVVNSDEEVIIAHTWDELRRLMWNYVGIVRSDKRLNLALKRIKMISQEIDEYYRAFKVTQDLIELRNLSLVAELIVKSALFRHESRGLHYSLDYLNLAPQVQDSILQKG